MRTRASLLTAAVLLLGAAPAFADEKLQPYEATVTRDQAAVVGDSGIDYEWLCYGYDCGIEFTPAVLKHIGKPGETPMEKMVRKFGLPRASKVAVALRVK